MNKQQKSKPKYYIYTFTNVCCSWRNTVTFLSMVPCITYPKHHQNPYMKLCLQTDKPMPKKKWNFVGRDHISCQQYQTITSVQGICHAISQNRRGESQGEWSFDINITLWSLGAISAVGFPGIDPNSQRAHGCILICLIWFCWLFLIEPCDPFYP